jgi:ABC-type uncharacterized transport system substrate-binding protein
MSSGFLSSLKRLGLGLALVAAASSVLLLSDAGRRTAGKRAKRVALFTFAPSSTIDGFSEGVLHGLAARGFEEGKTAEVRKVDAGGDVADASAIAKELVAGGYDVLITATTPCLQAVANNNRQGKALHVFGLVTDPFGANVGLRREDPLAHPRWFVGLGSFQPVAECFKTARELLPSLARVGVVWNPAEQNSQVATGEARKITKTLGIELLEANAGISAEVPEAAASLVVRGAQAIWVGGDNVANNAIGTIVNVAKKAHLPVFANNPDQVKNGVLFGLGADFPEVGRLTGDLAGAILQGDDPATIPVRDVLPKKLAVSKVALAGLADPWSIPPLLEKRADVVRDADGIHEKKARPLAKKWRVRLLHFAEAPFSEDAEAGFKKQLRASGLVEGRDYELKVACAQGDIATLAALFLAAETEGTDLYVTTSTPTLQAAVNRVKNAPVIFTAVADPVTAGAAKSYQDHVPNITGVATGADYGRVLDVAKACVPGLSRVGTLFVPAEANCLYSKNRLDEEAKKRGLEVIALPVADSADVATAAQALTHRSVDAVCQLPSNLTASAFASIARGVNPSKIPLFSYISRDAKMGSLATVARDYEEAGADTARLAARVMRGEDPAAIPIQPVSKSVVVVNLDEARRCGVKVPDALLKEAVEVVGR